MLYGSSSSPFSSKRITWGNNKLWWLYQNFTTSLDWLMSVLVCHSFCSIYDFIDHWNLCDWLYCPHLCTSYMLGWFFRLNKIHCLLKKIVKVNSKEGNFWSKYHLKYKNKLSIDIAINSIKLYTLNHPSYKWSPISLQSGSIMPICRKRKRIKRKIHAMNFDEKISVKI